VSVSAFAIRHPKAVQFSAVVLCIAGAWAVHSLPVAILPDITFPRLVLIAEAGDRPARMMTVDVVRPLEEAIAPVPGVTKIRSKTQRGATEISVDFRWGTDMLIAQQLVDSRVNEVRPDLPSGTVIAIERMNPTVFPVLGLSLRSEATPQTELWNLATYVVRPRLMRVPGVRDAVVQGGRVPEIAVDIDPRRLTAYHLSLPEVEQALAEANIVTSVGRMDRRFQQYQVIVSGQLADTATVGETVVSNRGGVPVYLRQIADIHRSVEDQTTVVTADAKESVLVSIVRQPEANTIAVADAVQREMSQIRPLLPAGISVQTFYDQSVLVHEAVGSVRDAVLIGAALSVVVLFLFLGNVRATLMTILILPATLLIGFLLMRAARLSLNLMTLGALAVGIGLVIDTAIVVVENVVRHLGHHPTRTEAVHEATEEVAVPLVSSTLTTIVVFLPLMLLTGVTGAFFTGLAVTLTIALAVSLVIALLVSPTLCATYLRVRPEGADHGPLLDRVIRLYERTFHVALRRPWLVPVGIAAVLLLTVPMAKALRTGFMPEMDEGSFVLDYLTAPGTSLAESDRVLRQVERILKDTPEVSETSRRTGTEMGFFITEPNSGDFTVMLKPGRRRNIEDVMADLRERIAREVPGVDVDFVQVLQDLIGDLAGAPAPVQVRIFGESQAELNAVAARLATKLENIPGLVDVKSGIVESGPELVVRVDPSKAGRAGMTATTVAEQAEGAMFGDVPTHLLEGDREVGVRVRFPAAWRSDTAELSALPIRTPSGSTLPLRAFGRVEVVPGTTETDREDQRRLLSVTGRLEARDLGSVMRDVKGMMQDAELPAGISYALGGQYESQKESFRGLVVVLVLAVLLVFAVMLFQFESFLAPTVILLIMPLSLFGAVLALWVTGTALNVSSFMGAIMLVGIVVKNGILLLDQAQKGEAEGLAIEAAVLRAGRIRLRPILMTTLTAIWALVPLALGIGAGAAMQKPLAVAVIGGLALSTVFTLLLAPLMYVTFRRWQIRIASR
jgi:CzcA family heavy metal efflux pump